MKIIRWLALTGIVFSGLPLFADAPNEIYYQGKLTDAQGNPKPDGSYPMDFGIYDALENGNRDFLDRRDGVQVANGVFEVNIGACPTNCEGDLKAILQGNANKWLQMSVEGQDLSPRQKLNASPYALAVAADAVGTAQLTSGAVTDAKVASGISGSKITGAVATANNLSGAGNITITGAGLHYIQNGNLSVGAQSAPEKLSVVGNIALLNDGGSRTIMAGDTSENPVSLYIKAGSALDLSEYPGGHLYLDSGNSTFGPGHILIGTVVDSKVGIGITNPSYKLQLGTDSAAKPNGGGWSNSSDIRVKKNIQPISGALDKMLSLRGVSFQWVHPEEHGNLATPRLGFIAQESEQVFPEWITEVTPQGKDKDLVGGGKIKSMGIFGFEALTVEAVRELKAENESLKAELNQLKEDNQRIEDALNHLKAEIQR
ncbi:MAG: tail fiber domain-containing protein [Elusimicrobia bacterium]|nr:tail fiber domain-containing protein [Elusimicrobiota bacterium]